MKRSKFPAAVIGGLLTCLCTALTASAQEEDADAASESRSSQGIALLDVSYFYENHPGFKERLSELKADTNRSEQAFKKQKEELEGLEEQLKLLAVGTPEHAKMEAKVNQFKAQLAASFETQKAGFLRREARVYYDVYQEMAQEVEAYAKAHGITLVLRVHDNPVNVAKPDEVLKRINQPVIWHDQKRDITRTILQRLQRKLKASEPEKEEPDADPAS